VVTDTEGRARRIQPLTEHETAGFLESKQFLKPQGAHRGDGFKMLVKSRDTHSKLMRNVVNSKRLIKSLA
jgi:hypothetical protein